MVKLYRYRPSRGCSRLGLIGFFQLPRLTVMLFLCLLIAGCSGPMNQNDLSEKVSLLGQADHCEQMAPGVAWWDAAMAGPSLPGDLGSRAAEAVDQGHPVLTVFLGQRPTPGYGASLESVTLDGRILQVSLEKREPDPERMMAQVITTPCLLLELPVRGWQEVEVILDAEGFPQRLGYPNTD